MRTLFAAGLLPSRTPPTPPALAAGLQKLLHIDADRPPTLGPTDARAQLAALDHGVQGAMDAQKAAQAAQRGIDDVRMMLQAAVSTARPATDEGLPAEDRQPLQANLQILIGALDRVVQGARFGGMRLLDGSLGADSAKGGLTLESLGEGEGMLTLTVEDLGSKALGLDGLDLSTAEGAEKALEALRAATDKVEQQVMSLEGFGDRAAGMISAALTVRSAAASPGYAPLQDDATALSHAPVPDGLWFGSAGSSAETLTRLLG